MRTVAFSESIFQSNAEYFLDQLLNIIAYDKELLLIIPDGIGQEEVLKKVKLLSGKLRQKFDKFFKRLNKEQRLIRVPIDKEDISFCDTISLKWADVNFYYPLQTGNFLSSICNTFCLASKSKRGKNIEAIDSFEKTHNSAFNLIPGKTTINDLEQFLEENIIRFTNRIEIIDRYLGDQIEENNYRFPPTLKSIYDIYMNNIRKFSNLWRRRKPEFIIHTIGDQKLKRLLEKKTHVKIYCYRYFPIHDRYLKTDHFCTQWGYGLDIFDDNGKFKKASSITIYRGSLREFKRILGHIPLVN